MKKVLIGYRRTHIEYYVRDICHDSMTNFLVSTDTDGDKLKNLNHGQEVFIVREKRFIPSDLDRENFSHLMTICLLREFQIHQVWI